MTTHARKDRQKKPPTLLKGKKGTKELFQESFEIENLE